MKKRYGVSLLTGAFLLLQVNVGITAPVQWTGAGSTGHWYEVVKAPGTWAQAKKAAVDRGLNAYISGTESHLATITSQAENDFITSTFAVKRPLWLGGIQDADAVSNDSGWSWITDEAWGFTNWAQNEPNNVGKKGEDRLAFAFWPKCYRRTME